MTARRTFAVWQPAYAAHGIATFPVGKDKRPAIRGYNKVGLRGSRELAHKFAGAPALGFMCGPRSKVTVIDIDTTDERVRDDAIERHGTTPLVIRTASGKWHLYYRHNGEPRLIRPWQGLDIDVLGARGFAVAPPSKAPRGQYQFVRGSLDDLEHLPVMRQLELDASPPSDGPDDFASPLHGMREHDGRNTALFMTIAPIANEIYADGGTHDALLDVALSHNRECEQPMAVEEVVKVVGSVWRMTLQRRNWVGGRGAMREHELASFSRDGVDAFFLLEFLRLHEGPSSLFWIANGLAYRLGWTRKRLARARARLLELGFVKQIRRRGDGKPAVYIWPATRVVESDQ